MNATVSPPRTEQGNGLTAQHEETAQADSDGTLLRDPVVLERLRENWGPEDSPELLAGESLVHLLRTWGAVYDRLTALLAPHGCSLAKYNLLIVLKAAPEKRLPMSELGERMSVTCANVTRLVDSLEQEGLVRRANRPGDRRVVLAELTPEGAAFMGRIVPEQKQNVQRLWAGLSEADCRQLTHLLIKLQHSVLCEERETAGGADDRMDRTKAVGPGEDRRERQ
jgi:DNA-binding MarR family transcriptional regulator